MRACQIEGCETGDAIMSSMIPIINTGHDVTGPVVSTVPNADCGSESIREPINNTQIRSRVHSIAASNAKGLGNSDPELKSIGCPSAMSRT